MTQNALMDRSTRKKKVGSYHIPRGTIQTVVSLQTQVPGCSVTQTTSTVCGAAVRCIALQQEQALFA